MTFRPPESPALAAPEKVTVTGGPAGGTDGPASVVVVVLDVLVVVLELVDVELLVDVLVLDEVVLLDEVVEDVLVLLDVVLLDEVVEDVLVLLDVVLLDDVVEDVLVLLDVVLLDDVLVELLVVDVSVVLVVLAGGTAVHDGSPLLLPLQMSLYPPGIPLRTHALNCVQRRVSSPPFTIVSTT
jgi:hypothetical protein